MIFSWLRWGFNCLAVVLLLSLPHVAFASPGSGGNCAGCHGRSDQNKAHPLAPGNAKLAITSRLDGGTNVNELPVFEVMAGNTVSLQELVNIDNGDNFGISLTGRITGTGSSNYVSLVNGNIHGALYDGADLLKISAYDTTNWDARSSNSRYTLKGDPGSSNGVHSAVTNTTFTYQMKIDPTTAADYYALTFTTAGGAEDWNAKQEFYIHVLPVSAVWKANTDGNWFTAANWSTFVPSGRGATASFNGASPATVNVNNPLTLGQIILDGGATSLSYSLSGSTITLNNLGGTGNGALINVVSGTHTISDPIVLSDNASITGNGTVNLPGGISGNYKLSVTGHLTASSIVVNELSIGGAGAAQAVPEPSIIALLGFSVIGLIALVRRRQQSVAG